jgi:lipoyl(octanoyl) transferase
VTALTWHWLGRAAYRRVLADQVAARERVWAGAAGVVLLCEHPPVITLGRSADRSNILAPGDVAIEQIERGGDVTYHGPGQLVGYPILDLKPDRCDVRRYVRDIEEVLIRTAADFGVTAGRIDRLTGVWVGREKLGAIGVRIARWVTSHGFAFNVTTDLSYFDLIVPCGIADHGVTSLQRLTGRAVPVQEVASRVAVRFGEVFARSMTPVLEVAA